MPAPGAGAVADAIGWGLAAGADAAGVGCEAPGLDVTISCSPLCRPKDDRGSSGISVSALGGYPDFTESKTQSSFNNLMRVTQLRSC